MNEIHAQANEQTADQQDAFLSGWDDDSQMTANGADQLPDAAEGEAEKPAPEPAEADSAEIGDNAAAADQHAAETVDDQSAAAEREVPQTWRVKHMDDVRTLTAKDITPELLQKGFDYDRIRDKYDEAKPVMEMFTEFAKGAGMSVADYVRFVRAESKKAAGMSEDEARRTVELEDREAAVSAKEAAQRAETETAESARAKVQADIAEFRKAFPDIYENARHDSGAIPAEVWNDMQQSGISLTAAYSRYAVKRAAQDAKAVRDAAEAAAINSRNGQRATGSLRSAGNDGKHDAFLEGFDS